MVNPCIAEVIVIICPACIRSGNFKFCILLTESLLRNAANCKMDKMRILFNHKYYLESISFFNSNNFTFVNCKMGKFHLDLNSSSECRSRRGNVRKESQGKTKIVESTARRVWKDSIFSSMSAGELVSFSWTCALGKN